MTTMSCTALVRWINKLRDPREGRRRSQIVVVLVDSDFLLLKLDLDQNKT